MYNPTVETAHTFYVGNGGWLVHNARCGLQLGGVHKDVAPGGKYWDTESHHLIADDVSDIVRGDAPTIRMSRLDHYETGSWGSGPDAQAFRAAQKALIDSGRYDAAFQMGISDVKSQFGVKYDPHIQSMLDKMPKLPSGSIDWTAYPRK